MARYRRKGTNWLMIGLIAVVAYFLYQSGFFNGLNLPTQSIAKGSCPDDGTTSLFMRARNPLNSSADYLAATVYYGYSDGTEVSSNSLVGTGAFDTDTTTTECGKSYVVYTKNDGAYVFAKQASPLLSGASKDMEIIVPRSSEVEFAVYQGYANKTADESECWVQDESTTAAEAIGSGGVTTYTLKYRATVASAQFGSDDSSAPVWICIDADPTKYSKTNGVVLSGGGVFGRTTDLPKYCADNAYEVAYKIPAVKSTEGEKEISVTLRGDLGDPTTDVKFLFIDSHAFISSEGKLKIATADDAGTGVGETDRYVTLDMS